MIIPFPTTPYVVITSATITETRTTTCYGTARFRHDPPIERFFLAYEDSEGSHGVWDGESYDDALAAAREWTQDGVVVRDRARPVGGVA